MYLNKNLEKRILAFEKNCYRRLLQVHYKTHMPNVEIHRIVADWEMCCRAICHLLLLFFFRLFPSGVVTEVSPLNFEKNSIFRRSYLLHILLHHIQIPPLWASLFSFPGCFIPALLAHMELIPTFHMGHTITVFCPKLSTFNVLLKFQGTK